MSKRKSPELSKQNREKPEDMVDWSELQPDLIEFIARKLTIYLDYIKFRAVCMKWRSAVSPIPHHLPCQLPWLMVPYYSHYSVHLQNPDSEIPPTYFFSLSENKIRCFNLPDIHRERRCCGSSLGWLVLVDKSPIILLFNPITRTQFQLPPVTTFPTVLDYDIHNVGEEYLIYYPLYGQQHRRKSSCMRDFSIVKVVLSSSPISLIEDYIAVAILDAPQELVFCKKGCEAWKRIEGARFYCEDVIYYKGLFYALNRNGSLAICDVSGLSPLVTIIAPPLPVSGVGALYLVDSFGELLLVARYPKFAMDESLKVSYHIFRLDSSGPKWVEVKSLGQRMLFLGKNSSLCLLATDFSGCEGNRIYFTYEYHKANHSSIFNVGDGSIDRLPYCRGGTASSLPPPIWVTPNLC